MSELEINCANGSAHKWVSTGNKWRAWATNNTTPYEMPPPNLLQLRCLTCGIEKFAPYHESTTAG